MEWLAGNAGIVFAALVFAAGLIWGKPAFDAFVKSTRAREIFAMARVAFAAVEEMHRIKPMLTIAKSAAFLDELARLLMEAGMPPPTESEKAMALTAAKAINFSEKAANQVALRATGTLGPS